MMKAIVTGHTRGLGAAVAAELVRRGVTVLGLARAHAPDAGVEQVALDLADPAALAAWLEGEALRAFLAGADTVLLVNNAGTVNPVGPLAEQDPLQALRAATLNVGAPLALSAAVVRAAPGAEHRILHVSSGAGRSAYPGWSVYCATKAALDQHARAIALDNDPKVRAVSLAPGVVDTDMQAEIRATPDQRFPLRQRFVDMKDSGVLVSPPVCARALVDYLLAPGFGGEPVDDLRNRAGR
ncbi:short-chain dehydrogenase [Massilia sp. KIM]|uniref:SDR family oxidoreductase n=1 Tax=Massilia sp. KIM TaxID=1955422 RepID=UPI0009900B26|nr:SDR family oxidoreductase [Massilia sp. KIM]OON63726.1 short-chain dehydrogenase [Massilia sp. KIM]